MFSTRFDVTCTTDPNGVQTWKGTGVIENYPIGYEKNINVTAKTQRTAEIKGLRAFRDALEDYVRANHLNYKNENTNKRILNRLGE
jgi:hypothetical protein